MKKARCLIVDDEPDIRELVEITLARMQIDTVAAADLREARAALAKQTFDLCLTDMRLPDGDGIDLIHDIARDYPQMPVAMITAHGNMESAIDALKAGAFDFVSKPVDLKMLRGLVESALKLSELPMATRDNSVVERPTGVQLLGKSAVVEEIRRMTAKLARSQAPVHITGESGTGKELAARLIHEQGPRAQAPFVAVNCGAIPQELMESEFFGHLKGSFTGAVQDKAGLFQAANGGTLFLDEVAELPLSMQVKLLRAIQEKSVRPVGSTHEQSIDVRILSATHHDLTALVESGGFRQDLFYRINVIELNVPPLRERREDIPVLIDHVLARICSTNGQAKPRFERAALARLYRHPYPGNVRELENIIERALALCDGELITSDDLRLPENADQPVPDDELAPDTGGTLQQALEKVERQLILQALEQHRWNRTAAASELGISLRQLRYRMTKLQLDGEEA